MTKKGFFKTSQDREIYYEYDHSTPLEKNSGLIVFLNGLSDSIETWVENKKFFKKKYHFLFIDLIGQGKSLEAEEEQKDVFYDYRISADEQAQSVKELIEGLNITSKFYLVGFSYGGGVAIRFASLFPNKIAKLILFLPYIIRLDMAFPMQRLWASQFNFLKNVTPLRPGLMFFDQNYQKVMRQYMNFRFSNKIPDSSKRQISIQLTEGIMPFNAFLHFEELPNKTVHLITVDHDSLVPKSLYEETWDRLPENKKCTWLRIHDGEHLIFDQAPMFCIHWIENIISTKTPLQPEKYLANSYRMEVFEIVQEDLFAKKLMKISI